MEIIKENIMTEQPQPQPQPVIHPPVEINLKTLLESGAHFGSKTSLWHPKMSPFIFGSKKNIYIINLEKTIRQWSSTVRPALVNMSTQGKSVLFVGTKKQGREALIAQSNRTNSPYVAFKWRPGLLTNFKVVKSSIDTLKRYEAIVKDYQEGKIKNRTKKEISKISKEIEKLTRDFGGIRNLTAIPDVLFVTDAQHDSLAVAEAKILNIPVISIVDTSVDPTKIDYPIPANSSAIKTLNLIITAVAEAILEGQSQHRQQQITPEPLSQ